jgi:hypothetical protein
MKSTRLLPVLLAAVLLAACKGHVTVAVTDAAVDDANAVVIEFTAVELQRSDGRAERFTIDPPLQVDVLALAGGERAVLLDAVEVPTDQYHAVRLFVSADGSGVDSYVDPKSGTRTALQLGAAGGLTVAHAFGVSRNGDENLTIDFDLRRSIRQPASPGAPYGLVPALRAVEDGQAGSVAGEVAPAEVSDPNCVPAVYVYAGSGVTPGDVGGGGAQPVNTGRVGAGPSYRVGLLPAGSYTAALTCQANLDEPEGPDAMTFIAQHNVTVVAGVETRQDF